MLNYTCKNASRYMWCLFHPLEFESFSLEITNIYSQDFEFPSSTSSRQNTCYSRSCPTDSSRRDISIVGTVVRFDHTLVTVRLTVQCRRTGTSLQDGFLFRENRVEMASCPERRTAGNGIGRGLRILSRCCGWGRFCRQRLFCLCWRLGG